MPDGDIHIDLAEGRAIELEQRAAQRRALREMRRRARAARLWLVGEAIAGSWGFLMRDLAGLAGAAGVAYGAWLAWPPAGFIAGGLLLLAGAWISASRGE